MTEYRFSAVIGHDEDGYWGQCPELQGCYTQGITFEETVENLKEVIVLHLEDRLACRTRLHPWSNPLRTE